MIARNVLLLLIFYGMISQKSPAQDADSSFLDWAKTPPMGWNSWDCYGPNVTEEEVKSNADYMAKNLKQLGWEYIVVDIRWFVANDKSHGYNETDPVYSVDEFGRFIPALSKFPSAAGGMGFKSLADYVHRKGLKFGIHVMRGVPVIAVERKLPVRGSGVTAADIFTMEGRCKWLKDMYTIVKDKPGAQEYYNSVFKLYASWGVDFVKVDDLSYPYHSDEIEMIRKAIDGCGRKMVLSTSPGEASIENADHIKTHANMWRIMPDFWDDWSMLKAEFDACARWIGHSGPGHWPDADMLPIGRLSIRGEVGDDRISRFTRDEQKMLMTLFAIVKSPLMFGGDLPSNDDFTISLITNRAVLKVNQHSTGNRQLFRNGDQVAWTAEDPEKGDQYLAVFNIGETSALPITVDFRLLGLSGPNKVVDLWGTQPDLEVNNTLTVKLAKHGSGLFRIRKIIYNK